MIQLLYNAVDAHYILNIWVGPKEMTRTYATYLLLPNATEYTINKK